MEVKKIKILVDAHIFDHSYQGTATYLKGLYNALVKFDDVEIVLSAYDLENLKMHFPDAKFHFVKLNTNSKVKRLALEYPKIIREGNFDYAHFQYIVPLFNGCKIVNTIHDLLFLEHPQYFPWTYRFTKNILFKYSAKKSDLILTVSEYSKRALIKYYKLKEKDVVVTPNAVSITDFKKDIDVEREDYILYVSRFEPRKNHIALLQAYLNLELYKKDIKLIFVGSKHEKIEEDAYNNLIALIPADIKKWICFVEKITDSELNDYYKHAKAFVFPSLAEGFGIPPLEAGINNCKVLCSNLTAMKDFTFFKYQFDPKDSVEFEIKLMELLNDAEYPYNQVKDSIKDSYNWDNIAQKYLIELKKRLK